ncbi:MAG: Membrane protein insertase YidC, partial [Pedosphaera sp.]|nr:Membrane protein insertase YidC [Pedosphaera sp.]
MDRKSIIVVALCFILIIAWQPLIMPRLRPPVPVPVSANQAANVTANTPAGATNAAVAPSAGTNAPVPAGTAVTPAKFVVRPEIPEQLLVVTNENGRYIFTSRGGGLKEVELTGYAEAVSSHRKKNRETNEFATLNSPAVPPVFAMVGDESLQGDGVFKLTQTANGVRAEKSLPNGLTVVKDFQLSTNFIVVASLKLENRSQQPVTIPSYQWVAGTATPMGPQDTGLAESVLWFNGSKAETVSLQYFNTNTSSWFGLRSRVPETEYLAGSNNVYWSSAQNQFFTLAAMPDKPASAIVVHMVDLPPPTPEELKDYPNARRDPKGLEAGLVYPAAELKPGATLTNQFNLFAGPKEYQTLARLASRFNNEIDQVMGFGWSGPISKALLVTMNWFHMALGLPYGWVIIIITLLIKLVFWPLTQASTRSAKRMQALQPQLKALQEKYKDEPQKFTAKQWEFYKKN